MKVLKEEIVTVTVDKAFVEVSLQDGSTGIISRMGTNRPDDDFVLDGESLLWFHLSDVKGLLRLDDGRRVPISGIKEMSPIKKTPVEQRFKVTKYRDWNMFPFGLSSIKVEELK